MNNEQLVIPGAGNKFAGPAAPNRFYPFYYRDVFDEIDTEPEYILGGYTRAICRYWSECCQGLPNNMETLQRVCRLTDEQWAKVRDTIFGKFFWLDEEADLWRHQRVFQEWTKASIVYASRMKGGEKNRQRLERERITMSLPPPRKAIAKARS